MRQTSSIFGTILALSLSGAALANTAVEPAPRLDVSWWAKRYEAISASVNEKNPRLVFIGDSISHFWEVTGKTVWGEEYDRYRAANLGISADRTEQVLWRLQNGNLDGAAPELTVILIGTNNIEVNSPSETVEGILAVVNEVRLRAPDTRILLLGLFPRNDLGAEGSAEVAETNRLLAASALDENTHYLDIGAVFLDANGNLNKDVMWDLLHLTEEGYRRWADAIRVEIESVLEK